MQDESSFYLNGIPKKMLAKKGSRPILRINGSRKRKHVSGAINLRDHTGTFAFIKSLNARTYKKFLRYLIRKYSGPGMIYVITDNAPAHRAKALKKFLHKVRDKLKLIYLPPYSPDLSEIEQLWFIIKEKVVYNAFYGTFQEFESALTRSLKQLKSPNDVIKKLCNYEKYLTCEG